MGGCFNLGLLEDKRGYLAGGNLAEARRLYGKACDGGYMGEFQSRTFRYKRGNRTEARRLLKKAYGGSEGGCLGLGLLEDKRGNLAEARRLTKRHVTGGIGMDVRL